MILNPVLNLQAGHTSLRSPDHELLTSHYDLSRITGGIMVVAFFMLAFSRAFKRCINFLTFFLLLECRKSYQTS